MLSFVLAGAELELVPAEVAGHPSVRAAAKAQERRPGELLLDQNAHGAAVGRLPDGKRRGRPDIVHYTLLTLLESPLCKAGGLQVAIHTRHGELVRVKPETRLPRGEPRFQGLMARVLREGRSQDKDPLIWTEGQRAARDVLAACGRGPVLRLDEGGAPRLPAEVAAQARDGDLTLVLGAFPSGAFPEEWLQAAPEAASIWGQPLNAWAVAAECVAAFRARWGPAQAPPASPAA